MRFKIDENLHTDAARVLAAAGHDVRTVFEQGLQGRCDSEVAEVCHREKRAIITLDLDFSDIRTFPPGSYSGIIVLRLADQGRQAVLRSLERLVPMLEVEPLDGKLWIVDERHLRIRDASSSS
jgi:predicted nuclease of predicted toxin-antitoxin system